jgi:putative ATPase
VATRKPAGRSSLGGAPGLFDGEPGPNEGGVRAESGAAAWSHNHAAPLAERLRPGSLDEVVGQEALIGPSGVLRRALRSGKLPSIVFWGPPGSGKTTLARLLAQEMRCHFVPFSAVTAGIKEIKEVMSEAERLRRDRPVLLFVDEIHRFNRAQQDAFLPYVERGDVVLVGATTENPSFELNSALLSRCRVLVLEPLGATELGELLERALADPARGVGGRGVEVLPDARAAIVQLASGDARRTLSLLELVVEDAAAGGQRLVTVADVERAQQRKVLLYDKAGEQHFDLISALHKSLRESDPDAAVYWLLRMLEGGEEGGYVARRMVRFASEDIGLADPRALPLTLAAWDAFDRLGSPEGELALVQAVLYLALAPKSVATYAAEKAARRAIAERPAEPVPLAIRNAPTRLMKDLGYGRDYVYAPETEEGVGGLECLPESVRGERFFVPSRAGLEPELRRRLEELAARRERARRRKSDG